MILYKSIKYLCIIIDLILNNKKKILAIVALFGEFIFIIIIIFILIVFKCFSILLSKRGEKKIYLIQKLN